MPTITVYPSNNDSGWTNANNAQADDGSYATAAPAQNGTTNGFWYNFNIAVPAGAGIDSVTIEAEFNVSTKSSVATLGLQAYHGAVAMGTEKTDATEPLTDKVVSTALTGAWTVGWLNDNTTAGFQIRARATRGNSGVAVTFSLDYVKVTVVYTVATDSPTHTETYTSTTPVNAVGTSALVSVTGGHLTDVVEATGTAELAIIFDTGAALGSAELLSYVDITKALFDDGSDGGFTDYTTQANEDTANDVLMVQDHAFDHDEDSFYFLMGTYGTPAFYGLYMNITQAGTGNFVLAWEYYNGVAWVSLDSYILTFTGAIPDLKTAGINKIDIAPPADISDVLKNGFLAKWIRVRWVSGNNGQEVKAGRIKVLAAGDYTTPAPTFSFPIISANGLIHDMIHRIVRG